jgi:hypothetical protein
MERCRERVEVCQRELRVSSWRAAPQMRRLAGIRVDQGILM